MIYVLKHFDTPLIRFSAGNGAEPDLQILWFDNTKQSLFPLDLEDVSAKGLESWIRHRSIPRNRAYVDTILSSMGLSINRPFDIIRVSRGLSLNDCYWITEEHFHGSFNQYNLYDNRFSRILGQIAFTGYGSGSEGIISSSPEFTTNGVLPKCWRREKGKILLYKGGTTGASNTGFEPYSEYFASQIASIMGISAISYNLARWKNTLCSTCELFTDKEHAFIPVGRIVTSGGFKAVKKYYEELGEPYLSAFYDMIVFDAVVLNTDRHFGNFGFIVDSRTNQIIAPAPLFDHGNSLLNYAGPDALKNDSSILKYASSQLPRVYDGFIDEAKNILTHRHRAALRKLLAYQIKQHRLYKLPDQRIALLNTVIQHQAEILLRDQ